jgi:thiol-disulfide isomerase/thioredoxin
MPALIALVIGLAIWRMRSGVDGGPGPVRMGTPLPSLASVEGWLNLPDGETFDPTGELLVVDCWAWWCGPCLADLPRMAKIAADYRPRGVKFLGATQDSSRDLEKIRAVIERTAGFDWPVAYGADQFLRPLDFQYIPTVILFGRNGQVIWSGGGSAGLQQALDAAL